MASVFNVVAVSELAAVLFSASSVVLVAVSVVNVFAVLVLAAVVPGSAESIHDLIMSIIPVVGGVAASTAVFVIVKRVLRSI